MREGEGSEVAGGAVAGAGGLSVEAVAAHAMGLGAGSGNVSLDNFFYMFCRLSKASKYLQARIRVINISVEFAIMFFFAGMTGTKQT